MPLEMIYLVLYITLVLLVGDGKALSILTIENQNIEESTQDDGWGEWGDWHECSRTCGGGVTYMRRECIRTRSRGGSGCEGSDKMYTSCSIQDCPVMAKDFRTLQCAQYNNSTYKGRSYQWIPYIGESATNPCELFCQPKSGEFFLKMADKVVDGTKCHSVGLDVCVDGSCETVGCDKLLGSKMKLDACGECGGDGTSCYLVKRSITAKLPSGYVPLIFIPPGATQVHVYEKKASKNFLAVRDSGKRYILNGHWQINSSSLIHLAGSDLIYSRNTDRKRSLESIKITGPTSQMLYIDILVQDRNRGIEYEFYLPRGMRDLNYGEHGWFTEHWQPCSARCGGGVQKRRVVCKNNNSGERVLNYLCYAQDRPQATQPCNTDPCEARWFAGKWESCTKHCGGGVQIRRVNCIQGRGGSGRSPFLLPDERCRDLNKPEIQRQCSTELCREWTVGEWSRCSRTCGIGVQRRQVACPSPDSCDTTLTPSNEQSCNLGPCSGIDWITTEWSECIGGCREGVQTREVTCSTEDNVRYPENLCNSARRPHSIRNCDLDSLCPDRATWVAEEWSDCSVTCGVGIQIRRVVCAVYDIGNYRRRSDIECSRDGISVKPATAQDCLLQNCTGTWYAGSWGPCSVSCNGGVRSRVVLCVSHKDVVSKDEACEADDKPNDSEVCNHILCGVDSSELPHAPSDCHRSTYGCCPDGVTAASGPFQESCDLPRCRGTRYGCCPDGYHAATAGNDEGCPDTPSPTNRSTISIDDSHEQGGREPSEVDDSARCRQGVDRGDCDNWTIYWFFDIQTAQCHGFWFGGCRGNSNRFETLEKCAQTCKKYLGQPSTDSTTSRTLVRPDTVAPFTHSPVWSPSVVRTTFTPIQTTRSSVPSSRDPNFLPIFSPDFDVGPELEKKKLHLPPPLCFLRKSSGPCESKIHRWNFDGVTGKCVSFWYGGCGGNENNFASKENCVQICGDQPIPMFQQGLAEENTPPVPVSIKPGRTEVYAQVREMARLACMAEGSPTPTVTWRKVGQASSHGNQTSEVLEDHSLIISKITSHDEGTYECTASNGHGPDQRWSVKLIVKDRLLIRETPTDTTVYVGEPAALRCRIPDDVLFVTWYKDGRKVQIDDYYNVQPWGDLHIIKTQVQDGGVYTCTAYAIDASQSATALLTVSQKEQVTARPPTLSSPVARPPLRRTDSYLRPTTKQCRDYPEYANCNIVVSKRMCHKHNYARYCCASCGGEPSTPPRPSRRQVSSRRFNTKR